MSENPTPGSPTKSGVGLQVEREAADKQPSSTGTLAFSETPDPNSPPKSGFPKQQPRPENSDK
jgi:hypothetical protein